MNKCCSCRSGGTYRDTHGRCRWLLLFFHWGPAQCLAPLPLGVGLVQERVFLMVRLPDPQVLEHAERQDSLHTVQPPCTETVNLHYCSCEETARQQISLQYKIQHNTCATCAVISRTTISTINARTVAVYSFTIRSQSLAISDKWDWSIYRRRINSQLQDIKT